jgi:hypothetical protein
MSTATAIACTVIVLSLGMMMLLSRYEFVGPTAVIGFLSGVAFATSIAVLATQPA